MRRSREEAQAHGNCEHIYFLHSICIEKHPAFFTLAPFPSRAASSRLYLLAFALSNDLLFVLLSIPLKKLRCLSALPFASNFPLRVIPIMLLRGIIGIAALAHHATSTPFTSNLRKSRIPSLQGCWLTYTQSPEQPVTETPLLHVQSGVTTQLM
jgi:hypothetical protein